MDTGTDTIGTTPFVPEILVLWDLYIVQPESSALTKIKTISFFISNLLYFQIFTSTDIIPNLSFLSSGDCALKCLYCQDIYAQI